MLKNITKRIKYTLQGEEGDLNTQMVVITTVCLMISAMLLTFKHQVEQFFIRAGTSVDELETVK